MVRRYWFNFSSIRLRIQKMTRSALLAALLALALTACGEKPAEEAPAVEAAPMEAPAAEAAPAEAAPAAEMPAEAAPAAEMPAEAAAEAAPATAP
jgi:predicted small lipoprotein YifL